MQIFLEILDENLLIESLYENWWLQTSDTIRLALAASSIHKAAAAEYCRRGGAERRTQRASRRHKPCVHAAPLPHAAPRGVPCRRRCRDSGHGANRWRRTNPS